MCKKSISCPKWLLFSIKRDIIAWWCIAVCTVGLFLCKVNIGIIWPNIAYIFKAILKSIFSSGLAGSIFYIIVNCIPQYKSRGLKLRLLGDNISDIKSELKEGVEQLNEEIKDVEQDKCKITLNDDHVKYLQDVGRHIVQLTDSTISYMDILPNKLIQQISDIFTAKAYLRFYYQNFTEQFTRCKIKELIDEIQEIIEELETLSDKIEKLNR